MFLKMQIDFAKQLNANTALFLLLSKFDAFLIKNIFMIFFSWSFSKKNINDAATDAELFFL